MKIPAPKIKATILVRDRHGRVKFDDWNNIPEIYHPHLTPEDWGWIHRHLGAQGDYLVFVTQAGDVLARLFFKGDRLAPDVNTSKGRIAAWQRRSRSGRVIASGPVRLTGTRGVPGDIGLSCLDLDAGETVDVQSLPFKFYLEQERANGHHTQHGGA